MPVLVPPIVDDQIFFGIDDLMAGGLSRNGIYRAVRAGRWKKIWPGVFVESHRWGLLTRDQQDAARLQAMARAGRAPIAFSHDSAALLHGISLVTRPETVHVSARPRAGSARPGTVRHLLPSLDDAVVRIGEDLHATSLPLTAADCARTLPLDEAVAVLDQVLAHGIATADVERVLRVSSARGRNRALRALRLADPRSGSVLESLARVRLVVSGIEPPTPQLRVVVNGRTRYLDFAWKELMLALETDGRGKYTDYGPAEEAVLAERDREKELMAAGWMILRSDWSETVHHGRRLVERVRRAIEQRRAWMAAVGVSATVGS